MPQTQLFQNLGPKPLAELLRPTRLEDLLGPISRSSALMAWLRAGARHSAILWGPPGTGKTSIAELAASVEATKQSLVAKEFIKIHAFDSGVKELREIIQRAKTIPSSIVLFVDEVHSFNKTQQDILLDAVEKGYLIFIGATTENPAVSINRALLSRVLKFELKAHEYRDLEILLLRAESFLARSLSPEARDYLIKTSQGDARSLLTNLELLVTEDTEKPENIIGLEQTQRLIDRKHFAGDSNTYYDCVSALQKSMRGSDPQASLYWLARLLNAGADLEQIARRILVTASEDVGLADPQALVIANAAYEAALKLGMPEARIPLAQAVAYIAKAAKSNASYMAMARAMADARDCPPYAVPEHLRNHSLNSALSLSSCPAKTVDGTAINPQTNYKYPHDYPGHWVEQAYLPEELATRKYLLE